MPTRNGWSSLLLAATSGALLVLAFAPFAWPPLAILALAGLYQTLAGAGARAGFGRGWVFGLGLFGCGVFWIRISLDQFGNLESWLAQLLTALFIAGMALYYGIVGGLIGRFGQFGRGPTDWRGPLLLLPGSYVLVEWLRGWFLTGFPWLSLGQSQLSGPLAGYVPLLGVHGVSLLVALSGGLLWGIWRWRGRWRWRAALALLAIVLGGAGLRGIDWTHPAGAPLRAAVLQANIPQEVKWAPESRLTSMETYWELTSEQFGAADLIVWPETAVPDFLHQVRGILIDPMRERARDEGVTIVLGIPVLDETGGRYYNSLISLGAREDRYDKRHLVPFGEFLPLKDWLGPLVHHFAIPMSDFSRGGAARPLLTVGDWQAGVSICYEDAFAAELIQALPDAALLINVSNDAWFGDSLAPYQHLEIARLRALETGRDLVRATNTGISAIIDARGRVLTQIPAFTRGGAVAPIQPRQGLTPFARFGHWPALMLALGMVMAGAWQRR